MSHILKLAKNRLLIGNKQSYNAKLFPDNLNFIFGIQLLTGRSALFLRLEFYKNMVFDVSVEVSFLFKYQYTRYYLRSVLDKFKWPNRSWVSSVTISFPSVIVLGMRCWPWFILFQASKAKD